MNKLTQKYKQNPKEYIGIVISFAMFLFLAMYKLTDACLWLDETLEYYIGRTMTGYIPWYSNNGVTVTHNMYERMLGAFQPPLYNFASYFWLLISDTEWWFRFSGVLMSGIAAIGIYQTVKKFSTYRVAATSVVLYSCIYQIMYYTQECGEYIMLVMFLTWLFKVYLEAMEKPTVRNLSVFVLLCVATVYTQYGAAFVIVPLVGSVLWKLYKEKEWKNLKAYLIACALAGGLGGIPLIFLFVIPQLANQTSMATNPEAWNFYQNSVFADLLQMFLDVFRWNTIESFTRFYWLALFASMFIIALGIFYCLKGKNIVLKHLLVCNVCTWFLYYLPTRAGVYGRGYFGFRYNIFFIPMWLITFLYLFYECYQMLLQISDKKKRKLARTAYQTVMIVAAVGYCVYGSHQILKHWEKADVRGCVQAWYQEEGYQKMTFVEPGQVPSFSYYYEHNESYQPSFDKNVVREVSKYAENQRVSDEYRINYDAYRAEIEEKFADGWPEGIYCFVGDINENPLIDVFVDEGYQVREVYRTTSQLYYLYK